MAFRKKFILIGFGLIFSTVLSIVLDSFLGSLLVASYQDSYNIFSRRATYVRQLSQPELGGMAVSYTGGVESVLYARQGSVLFMITIALTCAILSTGAVRFITRSFLPREDDRLVLRSVFWLSLLAVSGMYKSFPLSETPLGESLTRFLSEQWAILRALNKSN